MPNWIEEIRKRLVGLNLSPTREAEIIDELSQHLEERYRELSYIAEERAYQTVLDELDDGELLANQLRKVEHQFYPEPVVFGARRKNMIADFWQDLRFGFRTMRKNIGFTAVAVITLALGIGANTAIFSLVNGILLRALPYPESDKLVKMYQQNMKLGLDTWGLSQADFAAYRDQNKSFESIAVYTGGGANLTGGPEPERISTTSVSADFFKVLKVNPILGRTFLAGEDTQGKNNLIILTHSLWVRRFGSDPQIIGKTLGLNGTPTEIVGVMPAGFAFPYAESDAWTLLAINPARTAPYFFRGIARLKPGISVAQAEADTTNVLQNFAREHRNISEAAALGTPSGSRTVVLSLKEAVVGKTEKPLLVLLSAVGLVLLIACANVANLLLSRATARTREIAVRFSLGATPSRVARQLLTESLLLSLIGAIIGTALAWFGMGIMNKLPINGIPRIDEVGLNPAVLAFTAALAVFTGLLFGLVPALRAYQIGFAIGMRDGGRGSISSRRLNSALVALQFALSLILLIGAGLLLKSFQKLESVSLGFNPDKLLTMQVSLPRSAYQQPEQAVQFFDNLLNRMRNNPEIQSAGITANLPFGDDGNSDGFIIEGREELNKQSEQNEQANLQVSTPGTLQVMGVPLLGGRDFEVTDTADSPLVAIIDEPLARRYWPNGDAIGKRIETTGDQQWMTIVGIVGAVKHFGLAETPEPHIYTPMTQNPQTGAYLVIRARGELTTVVPAIRQELKQVDPNIPVYQIHPMTELISVTLNSQKLTNILLTAFSILALLLAAVGIYGTMSVYVGSRIHEFGIRLALGAQPVKLLRSVLGEGLLLTLAGVVLGTGGALLLTRTITSLLFEVSATDPVIFTAIPLLLFLVAIASCFAPAVRASRVDPLVALRYE